MRPPRRMTCSLVRMVPSARTMTPEPRLVRVERRGRASKKSRKNSSKNGSGNGHRPLHHRLLGRDVDHRRARRARPPPPRGCAAAGRSRGRPRARRRRAAARIRIVVHAFAIVGRVSSVIGQDEVDLAARHRDARHRHAHRVADAERAPGAAAAQQVVRLDVLVEVVVERADVHQALDEDVAQLDEEAERRARR